MEPFHFFSPVAGEDQAVDIRMYDGYKYPNIKKGYYYSTLRIFISKDSITSSEFLDDTPADTTDITVGLKQGNTISPVLFNNVSSNVTYDSSQPINVFYKASSLAKNQGWYSVDIRQDLGKIAWRKIPGPLK
jgi:hypothetical protein